MGLSDAAFYGSVFAFFALFSFAAAGVFAAAFLNLGLVLEVYHLLIHTGATTKSERHQ